MVMANSRGSARVMRLVSYFLMVIGGSVVWSQVYGLTGITKPLWWVMAGWLVIGGSACFIGQLARRWTGEFVGLPLIGSSLIGFSLLQLNVVGYVLEMVPSTALLWAFALLLFSRWRDVSSLYRIALRGRPA